MKKLWGARFEKSTDKMADKFSFSLSYDKRLAKYDCLAGIAHTRMLVKTKIISKKDGEAIVRGLKNILSRVEKGSLKFNPKAEDVHTVIQQELKSLIGEPADKLHTARSRNDLIVTDVKLYCAEEIPSIINYIAELQRSIVNFSVKNKATIIPAYTHMQAAQVVLLAHFMLAYVEMLERDKGRLLDCSLRMDECPSGSCALSGTSLPIDRKFTSEALGFYRASENSIDSVSDRDFIVETLSAVAILGMHISRMTEDIIIWSTSEFKYVEIDWSLCTGSSIMPHKKNPDIAELIRGETAKLYSNLNEVLVLLKGLPMTYNRDLQLDKPPLFESVDKIKETLGLLAKLFETLKVNDKILENRVKDEAFFTVDVMEYLIKKGVSYRKAHDIVGKIVKDCLDKGNPIGNLSIHQLKGFAPEFELDVKNLLHAKASVKNKRSFGSTNPILVDKQLKKWSKLLNA
ncbi:MAG: argininosuccinate lyase [Candidatus Omnitrophica bacterium]|nr:argininosuccinate lyase [Candidatus Omnitrophota bacterium]